MNVESIYRDVESWPLANGDVLVIVERRARRVSDDQTSEWWRHYTWHLRSRNGRRVGGGGETYVSKWNAKRAALRHHPRADGADQ